MNLKYLLAGVLVVALVAVGSTGLGQIAGFISSDGKSPNCRVLVEIDYGSEVETHQADILPTGSALDALLSVSAVDYEMQAEMGAFVNSINGVGGDEDRFWIYYVNGEMPDVACSHYFPDDGDIITFSYESF